MLLSRHAGRKSAAPAPLPKPAAKAQAPAPKKASTPAPVISTGQKTILVRQGNKRGIAEKILAQFPAHSVFVEPFFGAGGLFFMKPPVKQEIVNDADAEVYNLFEVIRTQPRKLTEQIKNMPQHEAQLKHWTKNRETDPVRRAVRTLFLANFSFMGMGTTMKTDADNTKKLILERIKPSMERLLNASFCNRDFRAFFKQIPRRGKATENTFIYADPPYVGTDMKTYEVANKWTANDLSDLIALCVGTGFKFAISEFDSPEVLKLAKKYKLKVVTIGERVNLENRRTEVMLKNY